MVNPSQEPGVDLDLLAQAYVLGELDLKQSCEFEAQLAESQPAREAVAHAVLWVDAIATQRETTTIAPTTPHRFAFSKWGLAAAAAIALALGLQFVFVENGADTTGSNASDPRLLIASWLDLEAFDDDTARAFDAHELTDNGEPNDPLRAPNWMLSALAGEQR